MNFAAPLPRPETDSHGYNPEFVRSIGNTTSTVVPFSGSDDISTTPLCSSTKRYTLLNPIPAPVVLEVKKGVKTSDRSSPSIPTPVSATETETAAPEFLRQIGRASCR